MSYCASLCSRFLTRLRCSHSVGKQPGRQRVGRSRSSALGRASAVSADNCGICSSRPGEAPQAPRPPPSCGQRPSAVPLPSAAAAAITQGGLQWPSMGKRKMTCARCLSPSLPPRRNAIPHLQAPMRFDTLSTQCKPERSPRRDSAQPDELLRAALLCISSVVGFAVAGAVLAAVAVGMFIPPARFARPSGRRSADRLRQAATAPGWLKAGLSKLISDRIRHASSRQQRPAVARPQRRC